jgi:hypothetical protein
MTPFLLAYAPTPEFWALLTLIATGVGHWLWQVTKDRSARLALEDERRQKLEEREQDRLDLIAAAEAAAKLNVEQLKPVIEQLENIDKNGANRLKVLISSNVTTRGMVKQGIEESKRAVETSNGIKSDLMKNGVKLITDETPTPTEAAAAE